MTRKTVTAAVAFVLLLSGGWSMATDYKRVVRDAVGVARELYESDNYFDKISGAGTLVDVGDKESLQFLVDYLDHSDWSLQRSAIDMMLNVQHPAGLDIVYRITAEHPKKVFLKFMAESVASKPRADMAEFLMSLLLDTDDSWTRKFALQALAVIPLDDKEARITAFAEDESTDSISRAYAYYVLMDTPARAKSLEKLLEISSNGGEQAQEAAAVGLGLVNNEQTRAALNRMRASHSRTVQMAAMTSAAGFGDEDAIQQLIETVVDGKGLDASVAAASVRRLPTDIAVEVSETLISCCELSSDTGTRLVESWGWIKADATKIYEWGLNHANPDIRMQAIWLVGHRGDRAYLDRVIPLLKDDDGGIRGMAAWTIVRMLGDDYDPGTEI